MNFAQVSAHLRIFAALYFLAYIQAVAGHGYVHSVVIGGQTYPGWNPFSDPYNNPPARVVRKIASDGPVGASEPDLACHHQGNEGTGAIAEAPAGSQITFQWVYWPGDHQGPVSTYMAACDGDCSTFSANNAQWFKLDDGGYFPDERLWAADKLRNDDNSWTSTIPANLASGDYLIRNEIIALHSVTPQFYPSCAQIRVTGNGSGHPSSNDLMTMQEIYNGANWPNIYLSSDLSSFVVPGPAPATLGGTSPPPRPSPTGNYSRTSTATPTSPRTPASATIPASPQKCFLASRRLIRRRVDHQL